MAQAIDRLLPANKKLAKTLIMQLAQQQSIQVNGDVEIPEPIENIPLWVAWLKSQGKSPGTIRLYEMSTTNYLKQDPHPALLSIQAYIAKRLERFTLRLVLIQR